jgi:hypothetical protein
MRLTEAEYKALGRPMTPERLDRAAAYAVRSEKKSKSKYGNHKVTTPEGLTFDSKAEYRRWCELHVLVRAKEITDLQRQVPFDLVPAQVSPDGTKLRPVAYVADFTYRDKLGRLVVEDPKGASTAEWVIKKKLMLHVHGIWVREIRS